MEVSSGPPPPPAPPLQPPEQGRSAQREPLRPRVTNACEACRVAKVKCRASTQLGICRRCLDSKRECIFKTGPRTRRPRQSKLNDSAPRPPPPPGPSKTFTIDIPMPPDHEFSESFVELRESHEGFIDDLVPGGDSDSDPGSPYLEHSDMLMDPDNHPRAGSTAGSMASHASSLPLGASALSTPPSSVVTRSHAPALQQPQQQQQQQQRSVASFGLQPQFNLDSAAALLETFRVRMLPHFPCVGLHAPPGPHGDEEVVQDEEVSVSTLARARPFVLLALLSAASGSRTLQGHSLYDEEFRKILGLKFVAGGERTLELLQGLVVYVAWYPFHLRPKNKQALQYTRMAVDIVHDLELDQDSGRDDGHVSRKRLEEMRTYLSTYYLVSNTATTWNRTPSLQYTDYTSHCCDLLDAYSSSIGEANDSILAWLVRLQRIVEEVSDMRRVTRGQTQSEYQIGLMLKGMESQLNEWEVRMAPLMATTPSLRMSLLSTRTFLAGAPLLKFPSAKSSPSLDASSPFRADPSRLAGALPLLSDFYEYLLTLPGDEWNAFSGVGWGSFIMAVILGFRLSFPVPVCPDWDAAAARRNLGFGDYLARLCRVGGEGQDEDVGAGVADGAAAAAEGSGSNPTPTPAQSRKNMDVLTASKVVMAVVRKKWAKRVAKLEPRPRPPSLAEQLPWPMDFGVLRSAVGSAFGLGGGGAVPGPGATMVPGSSAPGLGAYDPTMGGCPMIDGSLEHYYPVWDETYSSPHSSSLLASMGALGAGALGDGGAGAGGGPFGQLAQDDANMNENLWAMMTMEWAQNLHDGNYSHDGNFGNM